MKVAILERFPERIQARLESRERKLQQAATRNVNGSGFKLVIEDLKVWRIGTLKVSFKGGDKSLHKKIAEAATEWCKYANIKFNFGYSAKTKRYRLWRKNDTSHIRIGFADEGYWSLVGIDSRDPNVVDPGEISMNFEGFDNQLPLDWKGTVLHEFGHALGFHHEHQTPGFECDFDWPKLYEYLGGSPNFWSKRTVDHNLRQLPATGMTFSEHDKKSIMHYAFAPWMFLGGKNSQCYVSPNDVLSSSDKSIASKAYPFGQAEFTITDKRRKENLKSVLSLDEVPAEIKKPYKEHLKFLVNSREFKEFLPNQ